MKVVGTPCGIVEVLQARMPGESRQTGTLRLTVGTKILAPPHPIKLYEVAEGLR